MGIESIGDRIPQLPDDPDETFVHSSAVVAGNVRMGEHCSIWCNAVLRGDMSRIELGKLCNIQDGVVVHVGGGIARGEERSADIPAILGDGVSVGHNAIVHACTVGDYTLIGMGAIVMSKCSIGKHCIIGAGSLLTEGTVIPDGSMAFGSPARVIRPLTAEEIESNYIVAEHYWKWAKIMRS